MYSCLMHTCMYPTLLEIHSSQGCMEDDGPSASITTQGVSGHVHEGAPD